jgi:hypothetical protein
MSALTKLLIANRALRRIGAKPLTTFGETTASGNAVNAVYDDVRDEVLAEHPWSFAQKRAYLSKAITGATAANPVVISSTSHGLSNGDQITLSNITGMTELNNNTYLVANKADDTFELTDLDGVNIDGTDYTAYVSGGYITKNYTGAFDEDGIDYIYDLPTDFIKLNYVNEANIIVKVENNKILSDTLELKIKYTYQNDSPTTYFPLFVKALVTRLAAELCFQLTESITKAGELEKLYLQVDLPNACAADSQQGSVDEPQQDEWENERRGYTSSLIPGSGVWHPVW